MRGARLPAAPSVAPLPTPATPACLPAFRRCLLACLPDCLQTKSVAAVIVLVIIQFIALIWYTLSYIPFAREMICSGMRNCMSRG